MGGGGTQSIDQTFNLEVVNETVFEQITKNTNTIATAMTNIQEMEIEFGVIDTGCKATIGQTINADSTTIGQLDSTTLGESKAAIETELQASAQAALEKVTEAGNFQFGDDQNIVLDDWLNFLSFVSPHLSILILDQAASRRS